MKINPIIYLLLIVLVSIYACTDDEPIEPIEPWILECTDEYGLVNRMACDFEFRKGKWVEIQDSIEALYVGADTVHFMQDSLIGWSAQGNPYSVLVGYFVRNNLYKQAFNAEPNDPVDIRRGIITSHNDTTDILTIHWDNGLQNISYNRVD